MTGLADQTFVTLESLRQNCIKAYEQFKQAAKAIQNPDLKRILLICSNQRKRFAEELQPFISFQEYSAPRHGGETSQCPVHDCEAAILRWCVERDAEALSIYKHALSMFLPATAQFLIAAQYSMMCRRNQQMRQIISTEALGRLRANLTGSEALNQNLL